jgi:hypothetical protein
MSLESIKRQVEQIRRRLHGDGQRCPSCPPWQQIALIQEGEEVPVFPVCASCGWTQPGITVVIVRTCESTTQPIVEES